MLLRTLSTKKLHGNLDIDISFNNDITILVGINGSGKTSALTAVDWLLRPNLPKLALEQFTSLELTFEHLDQVYRLVAIKDKGMLSFSIESQTSRIEVAPITIELLESTGLEGMIGEEYLKEKYGELTIEKHEKPMWDMLQSFPSPTVITLDRQLEAETGHVTYSDPKKSAREYRTRSVTPIAHVQNLMKHKFIEYRNRSIQHDNELKARILMSALQDPASVFSHGDIKPMIDEDIRRLEVKVIKHLSTNIMADEVVKQVRQFFKSSRAISRLMSTAPEQENLALGFLLLQYKQIEALAKAFSDLETKNAMAFAELKVYLDAVNKFLKDSGKTLYFDEPSGALVFRRDGDDISGTRNNLGNIAKLSSGEQQILILFTFLKFAASSNAIFIVDEPELSLHPRWQFEFMKTFLELRPKNTQLLLATHSPEIVGRHKSSCVIL